MFLGLHAGGVGYSFVTLSLARFLRSLVDLITSSPLSPDNSLVTQSRFILLDSMLMLFLTLTLFCWVKFAKRRREPFSVMWWLWLVATGASLGLVMGVKMVGLFTVATVGVAVLVELWYLLDVKQTPDVVRIVSPRIMGTSVPPYFALLCRIFL